MATIAETRTDWTAADLFRRFGPIPLRRIVMHPAPGTATEEDVTRLDDHEDRLCELVDGVLVEKAMGWYESYLAGWILTHLNNFVGPRRLGLVAGADGMYRLNPGLVRIPDVSFIPNDRLPGRRIPRDPICPIIPALAVEVLSDGNTRKEMRDKLGEYFARGVLLVWYVDPDKKTFQVFTAPDRSRLVREAQTLDGGDVLPGFSLNLRDLFAEPELGPVEGP